MSPALVRVLRRRAFLALALVPLVTFTWVLGQTSEVRAGDAPVEVVSWVPTLGMDLAFRLGALQWLLALIVSGVGALVLVYCAWYFNDDDPGRASFTGNFTAFAGSMLGLVLQEACARAGVGGPGSLRVAASPQAYVARSTEVTEWPGSPSSRSRLTSTTW